MKAPEYILSRPWAMLPDRVEQMLAVAERTIDLEAVLAKTGKPLENTQDVKIRGNVALVPIRGVISRYADLFTQICGGTTVEHLSRDIRSALDDPKIEAIILEIDSPGGQVSGIGELAEQVRQGTQIKPIVSYVSNLGASAGYWLASAGSEIVASPSAILGSVGVVWPMSRTTDDGRTIEFVSSQSPNKRLSTETRDGKAKYQAMVDAMAAVFISAVAENRDMAPEKVISDFGEGGLLIGQAAVDVGMADRLGSLEQLISELSNGGPAGSSLSIKRGGAVAGHREIPKMQFSIKSVLDALRRSGNSGVIDLEPAEAGVEAAENNGPTARELELEARIKALLTKHKTALAAEAGAWFDAQVKAEKIEPTEKAAYVAFYVEVSRLDAEQPIAGFSRLGSFKAGVEARKPSGVTTESIPTDAASVADQLARGGFKVLPAAAPSPSEAKADAEIVAKMLAAANDV